MTCRISELQFKEVVDIADGTRYGYIGDIEIDAKQGTVRSLVIVGKARCFGLFGREADTVFPWSAVKRIGMDIILVDGAGHTGQNHRYS